MVSRESMVSPDPEDLKAFLGSLVPTAKTVIRECPTLRKVG